MKRQQTSEATHLIIGCGYLGRRVAALWLTQGKRVNALTRGRADELRALGIEPIVGDILEPATLGALPKATTILYAVSPDRSSGRSFKDVHIGGLTNFIANAPAPDRFIYVSSTSVYGQSGGEEVDETSPTEPLDEHGAILLEAEKLLRAQLPDSIVLRFAGIYGPGRIIRRTAVEKGEALGGDPDKWLNLIHVDDGARAVLAAEARGGLGETYLIADGHPVTRREFYSLLAQLLGAAYPNFEPTLPGKSSLPRADANRKLSNVKMLRNLCVSLSYPDCGAGLRASI